MNRRRQLYFFVQHEKRLEKKLENLKKLAIQHDFTIGENHKDANIIVSVGNDGTFLQAVRKTGFRNDCLYVGISTDNLPSFYCDFHIDELDKMVEAATTERIEVRKYPIIQVTVNGEHPPFYCLNECTIRSSIVKTFVIDVYVDDYLFETFRGDGMIISTPTGSTGYNKSVRGAVVDPLIPCFQVSEIASLNNNHYRTLDSSFILSGDRKLTLKVVQDGNDFPLLAMDNEALGISHVQKLTIQLSDRRIKTVKLKDNSFWHKVQRTFL
ncbi:NAD kinase [Fervidibacillus halotolerans]|uniref:NAD kinase n=1 Tax=Fervidibacillus halotolerans TaxID=2980027 RepID=A0A9E8LYN2_9BACI|nr:NAD kinase [Fervidibacillus halotolerans]WAA11690.1 NAD kinase [Fervidibacillus halotolerans]